MPKASDIERKWYIIDAERLRLHTFSEVSTSLPTHPTLIAATTLSSSIRTRLFSPATSSLRRLTSGTPVG